MKKNIFKLSTEQLKEIALALKAEVEKGLSEKNQQVQCLPTFIIPKTDDVNGKALVLDLGGTNYRVATVDFVNGKPAIHPQNGWKIDLTKLMKETKPEGFTEEELHKAQADPVNEIRPKEETLPIGYCFSYPAESLENGDAKLLYWVKGVWNKGEDMVNQPAGERLINYLNKNNGGKKEFTGIKVINDTVASLFAGLTDSSYDAYIGLIVGTGTNMATFIKADKITKLGGKFTGLLPVNLESGNFIPPHLTTVDGNVDARSDNKGRQRFEKAVSGMYLGEILKAAFPCDEFESRFDAQKLTTIMNYPDIHKTKYVQVARWIYIRSAKLVAASLVGLILVLLAHDNSIKKVRLTAEGSLFWSKDDKNVDYNELVLEKLHSLLAEFGHPEVRVQIAQMENANLIGSAIAALS